MIEKERKFLLKHMPKLSGYFNVPMMIKQGYLMLDAKKQLRIRIINDENCFITFKESISPEMKHEFEYKIPYEDAIIMYERCANKLEKKRFMTVYKNYHVDIDIYPSGKQVVEIEYEDELDEIPEYCGKEITGNSKYSNIWMAKQGNEIWPTTE